MIDIFPLHLFPSGGLSGSVITSVWVGVFVVAFFNLRFGWVLAGLVVPGYLVPLLLLKPWSVVAIVIEGAVTYFLVWLFSESPGHRNRWSSLFGRDRFFALIVISVVVRLVFDGLVFPGIGDWLNRHYHLNFDYVNNLHSFGLIVIALIANQFWKPGFNRGMISLVVTVGVSYVIVRYGLMELTNFSLGNVQYVYEDLASSILASPKAYIIIICTALIASRMNLYYGWEYNGILIPSLLALQWYEPSKIIITFVEAFIILGLSTLVMRLPRFAHANIEGARKLLLFFNVGFAYKWLLSLVLATWWPDIKVSDAFAFGYLLSSLMAIKMHDKMIVGMLTRSTLQTSLVSVLFATVIGYVLIWLPTPESLFNKKTVASITAPDIIEDVHLVPLLRREKVSIYQRRDPETLVRPDLVELRAFEAGLKLLRRYRNSHKAIHLAEAEYSLKQAGYSLHIVQNRYIYLQEKTGGQGRGVYIIDLKAGTDLLLEVPAPAEERWALDAGAWLFTRFDAQALAIAGSYRNAGIGGVNDVLQSRQTFFAAFQRLLSRGSVLQVRGYTGNRLEAKQDNPVLEQPSSLWVKGTLPGGLDLNFLERSIGEIDINWQQPPEINRLRDMEYQGFAELFLTQTDQRKLLAQSLGEEETLETQINVQRIDGYLQQWLLEKKGRLARRGTDRYRPPSPEELLYFDEEIITPLLHLIDTLPDINTQEQNAALNRIAAAARAIDYRLIKYHHQRSGEEYLILEEREDIRKRRYWGTIVLRFGPSEQYLVQVPRPLYELNSFEYAVSMFERLHARGLVVAGAHPFANRDGSADTVRMENIPSVFNLVSQVILRETPPDEPELIIHCRAFGLRPIGEQTGSDVLLAFSDGIIHEQQLPALGLRLLDALREDSLAYQIVDGTPDTAGYEIGGLPQSLYAANLPDKHFLILWLSPLSRDSYRQQSDNHLQEKQFRALNIPTLKDDLTDYLKKQATGRTNMPDELLAAVLHYQRNHDIVSLRQLQVQWPHWRLQRLIDLDSQQAFLTVADKHGVFLVSNLNPRKPFLQIRAPLHPLSEQQITAFMATRAGRLVFGEKP
ncbi:hypothetical protein MNBD_GAMMA14-848 [hydrothermal vent metagenome]|uniref:Capsule biosynthesis CapC n=1 Tax=hydrothermal vent metagenome TaxID=652676 RepID=A0A3B0Z8R3_9ZZZZ